MAVGNRCANHVTPLYPQKLARTSPTSGGRSVGKVRSRTKATEFSFSLDDEQMRSKYVEAWNKLIVKQKFCASSWLITEIKNNLLC